MKIFVLLVKYNWNLVLRVNIDAADGTKSVSETTMVQFMKHMYISQPSYISVWYISLLQRNCLK